MAKEYEIDKPIYSLDISNEVFKSILAFIYTMEIPVLIGLYKATTILLVADIFDVVNLKLHMESTIVDKILNIRNATEILSLADAYSCTLLKEAVMNMFAKNSNDAMNSEG